MITNTPRKPITLHQLHHMHTSGKKITMLTAYDATFAHILDKAEVDCILVGDSLGMVLQGNKTTVPVQMSDMLYHTRCVAQGNQTAWIVSDLPYGSYHESVENAYRNASHLMQAGADMVKLEGGGWTIKTVEYLVTRGIPISAHLGLTPQSVHALGGYRIQGKEASHIQVLLNDAKALESAGASLCVLELMPTSTADLITQSCKTMATIGIGAGNVTSGQVLVLHDMLGLTPHKLPRFVKNFLHHLTTTNQEISILNAIKQYVSEVKSLQFPDNQVHGYSI